ncbi:MAG: hypothetical protein OYI31_07030 [Chloroflexota bacterium]|nr:hypothetical protein [Chloroflexota bacterium]MDE2941202.1 hypothetical protein [Chloroflexota bacterium]MDE3268180.1 hypothetical protein [Chloroflexota bacterium]
MRAWLHENDIDVEERDFFKDRFDADELRGLLSGIRVADAFAWNSPSFKDLGLPAAELDEDRLLELMVQEPRLIRRPLVSLKGRLVIGASQKALEEALG